MINQKARDKIIEIWKIYAESDKIIRDSRGREYSDFNEKRRKAIIEIKEIFNSFSNNESSIYDFKTSLDSYNKKNNLWGFTAVKGQMFFNQLTNANEGQIDKFSSLLKDLIAEPKDLDEALEKIGTLEKHAQVFYNRADDKRKVPNPKSSAYFLSYFWQIQNPEKWAIIYTSLLKSFAELDIWEDQPDQAESYKYFYFLNEEIKDILVNFGDEITNWNVEHAFWNFQEKPVDKKKEKKLIKEAEPQFEDDGIKASFELSDYLIPKVAKLVEIGSDETKSTTRKGSEYEKLVAEIFKMLNFEVEFLGQGSGRNPDAILRLREANTAFIVDAKAYTKGYSLGIDDRAIKEYISHHCSRLKKDGYYKIGFIIISNSFKSNFDGFINEITWNTEIRRFILMTSEALLFLLAYKTKDNLSSAQIVENIVSCGNLIEAQNIIEKFDDF